MDGLATKSPYFQEFHCVLRQQALGLLMRPMNNLAVVQGLRRREKLSRDDEKDDENKMAAERAGVSIGSILVAVNGNPVSHLSGFEAAIAKVKAAGRPLTLGFRVLHPVSDPGFLARRLWQGILFTRFSLGKSWTGRFYVLRDDGKLDGFPGKEFTEPVETLRVALGSPVRCCEKEVQEAARAMGDLGDDGRGSLGPRVLAVPVLSDSPDTDISPAKWHFFRADSSDAKDDWLMAFTTLSVIHDQRQRKRVSSDDSEKTHFEVSTPSDKNKQDIQNPSTAKTISSVPRNIKKPQHDTSSQHEEQKDNSYDKSSSSTQSQQQAVTVRQGYMWLKVSTQRAGRKEKAAEFAARLEPWRRRWFVLRGGSLRWYASPPADEHEVPSGILNLRGAIVTVARLEHDMIVYNDQESSSTSSKSEKFELRVLEAARSDLGDRLELTLRCPSEHDGAEWVRLLRADTISAAQVLDSAGRRMQRLRRNPELAIESPEVAYALLVPVDRSDGGVDRDGWRQVAGYHLAPLCDVYVADIIFDALLGGKYTPAVSGHNNEQDDLLARDFLNYTTDTDLHTISNGQSGIMIPPGASDWREHLAKTYRTAKRFSVDASQRVSDLLYDKETQAARAQADVKTSRREAEALTSRDLRLSYETFRCYCQAFRHVVHQHKEAWDDLRNKLGLDGLEMLLLRAENVVDCFGDEGTVYLTEQRLYLVQRGGRVTVLRLDAVLSANLLTEDSLAVGGTTSSSSTINTVLPTVLRLVLKPGNERVYVMNLQRPQPANDAFLGDYPGGGRPFGGSVLQREVGIVHGGDADLSEVDDELFQSDKPRKCWQGFYDIHFLRGDAEDNLTTDRSSSGSLNTGSVATGTVQQLTSDDSSAPRWLEAVREMVSAINLASKLEARASWSMAQAKPLLNSAFRFYWQEVRADAIQHETQRYFFQAESRRLELWVALNFLRRRALRRCCGTGPRRLLVCTQAPDILRLFIANETEATLAIPGLLFKEEQLRGIQIERGWLRTAIAYASRLEDLHRRRRADIETFSAARFRDEWTVFWQHVDPIWDGFFDTIAQLRAWDKPLVSGFFFGGLLLIALTDRLDILPALFFLAYALAIIENGRRASARRMKRRNDTSSSSPQNLQDDQSSISNSNQKISSAAGATVATTIALASLDTSQQKRVPPSLEIASKRLVRLFQRGSNQDGELVRRTPSGELNESSETQSSESMKSKVNKAESSDVFGVFGQLRELRAGLGKAQAQLHDYNTALLRCRALHRWTDPIRTLFFVSGLLFAALCCATLPLNWLFALSICYFGSDPLFEKRGLSRAVSDEYFDGLPTSSRTHGNVYFAALCRRYDNLENVFPPSPAFYPPLLRLSRFAEMMTSVSGTDCRKNVEAQSTPTVTIPEVPDDEHLLRTWSSPSTPQSHASGLPSAEGGDRQEAANLRRRRQSTGGVLHEKPTTEFFVQQNGER